MAVGWHSSADEKLKKVAISGGPPQTLCDAPEGRGGAWQAGKDGGEGTIVFAPFNYGLLYRVSSGGGSPVPVTAKDPGQTNQGDRQPVFLPDGNRFLYGCEDGTCAGSLNETPGKSRLVMAAKSAVLYAPPGYLLFVRETVLMAQAFDPAKLALLGEAFPVARNVASNDTRRTVEFSVSNTGVLAWRENSGRGFELAWVDRQGKGLELFENLTDLNRPWISPEGKRALLSDGETSGDSRVWLLDLERKLASPITPKGGRGLMFSSWSPDGTRIVTGAIFSLFIQSVNGGPQQTWPGGNNRQPTDWTQDGRFIVIRELDAATKTDLWLLPVDGGAKPIPLVRGPSNEDRGRLSKDNRWLAYQSDESGQNEIYVTSFSAHNPGAPGGAKWRVSTAGGSLPCWSRDGKEIVYQQRATDGTITVMAAPVSGGNTFQAGRALALFDLPAGSTLDVARDGQRFLVAKRRADAAPPFHVSLNWLAMAKEAR